MINNGDGSFTTLRGDASGVVLPEDAMGLITVPTTDGTVRLITSINDGPAIELRHLNASSNRKTIQLKGSQTDLIGARLTVTFSDDSSQIYETTAGGGYLSQSDGGYISTSASAVECVVRLASGQELKQALSEDKSVVIDIGK